MLIGFEAAQGPNQGNTVKNITNCYGSCPPAGGRDWNARALARGLFQRYLDLAAIAWLDGKVVLPF